MDETQIASMSESQLIEGTKNDSQKLISLQQSWWIDYCALGGLLTHDGFEFKVDKEGRQLTDYNGEPRTEVMHRMTVSEFAKNIKVDRSTLGRWRHTIPNFNAKVYERRAELFGARESQLFNRLYLIAMSGNGQPAVQAATTLLGHFSKLQLPTQRQEIKHEGESWTSLMEKKRQVIEGEVVPDGSSNNNG
jgi:hypothetical protein